jgi:hypothetical protein
MIHSPASIARYCLILLRRRQLIQKLIPIAVIVAITAGISGGQEDSRAALIASQQEEKAGAVGPETQNRAERFLLEFRDRRVLERFSEGIGGLRVKMGGLVAGSGFAAGPEYHREGIAGGRLAIRTAALTSTRGYRKFDFQTDLGSAVGDRFFAEFYGVYHNYPGMNYYGPGPGSNKNGRSAFRLEDTALDLTAGVRPFRRLTAGYSVGYLFNNISTGRDSRFVSAEQIYTPRQAPGIDHQANFLRHGAFVQYDWRDNPEGARSGGNYFLRFSNFTDRSFGISDFRRLDVEGQQYFSLLNRRRVLALRAKSSLTFRERNRTIPFFMQPSLGGSEDLRGYRPFRFRDDNLFVATAEYRWEAFSGLDMAVFADAGQVFSRRSQFRLKNFETDAGFGFRFNTRNRTFLRLDFGFSHEGIQLWVKFNDVFKKGPVHTSSSMGDF